MDLIYIRFDKIKNTNASGILHNYTVDFDITINTQNITNDFELKTNLPLPEDILFSENEISTWIFIDDTEFGGIITGYTIDIENNVITYTGRTWRGMLSNYIIEPPIGQDYLTVSGLLSDIIENLPISPMMEVEAAAYSIGSYDFERFIPTFDGIVSLLAAANSDLRLFVNFEQTPNTPDGVVTLTIDERRDLRNQIDFSQDYNSNINLKITRNGQTPKKLICLGQGEGALQEVVELYADDDWNISTTPIANAYPVATYSATSSQDLESDGIAYFEELIANHEQIDVVVENMDLILGDIIGAKDYITEQIASAEITGIILNIEDYGNYQTYSFNYQTREI